MDNKDCLMVTVNDKGNLDIRVQGLDVLQLITIAYQLLVLTHTTFVQNKEEENANLVKHTADVVKLLMVYGQDQHRIASEKLAQEAANEPKN